MAKKNAQFRTKIEGVLVDLMVKTNIENVMYDETTTLATKLATIISDIASKASSADLANKANSQHTHAQGDITGLNDALSSRPTTTAMNTAIDALRQELLGDTPVEAYNTFTELAQYIATHKDAADALTAAVGNKADKSAVEAIQATLNALGSLANKSKVSESDLDEALAGKVNAASEGNHSHANKTLLDTYDQTNANIKDAIEKKHTHTNESVLDNITAAKVASWDGKANIFFAAEEPSNLSDGDLWFQIAD